MNTPIEFDDWRAGDQPIFVCNLEKAHEKLGWAPRRNIHHGVSDLIRWVGENREWFN